MATVMVADRPGLATTIQWPTRNEARMRVIVPLSVFAKIALYCFLAGLIVGIWIAG